MTGILRRRNSNGKVDLLISRYRCMYAVSETVRVRQDSLSLPASTILRTNFGLRFDRARDTRARSRQKEKEKEKGGGSRSVRAVRLTDRQADNWASAKSRYTSIDRSRSGPNRRLVCRSLVFSFAEYYSVSEICVRIRLGRMSQSWIIAPTRTPVYDKASRGSH